MSFHPPDLHPARVRENRGAGSSRAAHADIHRDTVQPTIFHEPWWLEAATGNTYQCATVTRANRIVGSFPYVCANLPLGTRVCGMAPLTHVLGPGIVCGPGNPPNRRLKADGILRELLMAMGSFSGFHIKMHRGVTDTLVFQEHGYRTSVQFTYELQPAAETLLWAGMRDKTRNVIRQARTAYNVRATPDPEFFETFYAANLIARSSVNNYRHISAVCRASLARNRSRILTAHDRIGKAVAAIMYVWDEVSVYYLLSTRAVDAGNGAVSLLIWNAICDAASRNLLFDFDGVATPGSRLFYTGFGGVPAPRYIVSRFTLRHRIAGRLSNPFRLPTRHTYQW